MKYLVTYLAVSLFFAVLATSVGQMASSAGDVRPLNRWLRLFFSINLIAAILFWAQPPSSASIAAYAVTHLALLLYSAINLRATYGRVAAGEEHTLKPPARW
jgi:O-antigen/teichoic acid export membrane protein